MELIKITFFYGIVFISVGFGVILQKLIILDDIFYLAFMVLGFALITLSAIINKYQTQPNDKQNQPTTKGEQP